MFARYSNKIVSYLWSPHLKRDTELIEQVQRRSTKRLHGLSNYTCDERLKMLNLKNLQSRSTHFDLIMCYIIIFGIVCVNANDFFEFRVSNTRGHFCKSTLCPKKVSPVNILQQPRQTCTDLNEILHTQDDIYFCHRRQIS